MISTYLRVACLSSFVGYSNGEPLAQAYASGDILSSRPLSRVSAWSCSKHGLRAACRLSRVGGAQDMIAEGVSGYTFAVNDGEA